jgi:hypothetical protein
METIEINGEEYIKKSEANTFQPAEKLDGLTYGIFRTYSAGVFAGYKKTREGKEAVVLQSRRLYYWEGAFTLSQIAEEGVAKPDECKFAMEITGEHELTEVIEFIPCTEKARLSIKNVPNHDYNNN